jgi:hypothetical protein
VNKSHTIFIIQTFLQLKSELQRVHAFSMKTWTIAEAEKKLARSDALGGN